MFVILLLIVLCFVKLTVRKPNCEENISLDIDSIDFSCIYLPKPSIMNKIISTIDRIFMAVVGPSGCGKTNLIFRIIAGNTFYPKFKSVIFLYHEMQPIYSQIEQHSNIVFKKFTNLEFLKNTENCLLIFDDSCEEIFNDKEFVKLATTGRHKNINVIYMK